MYDAICRYICAYLAVFRLVAAKWVGKYEVFDHEGNFSVCLRTRSCFPCNRSSGYIALS